MKQQIVKLMVAIGFATVVVAGTITSCDDDVAAPGANQVTYDVTLTGAQVVPATGSAGAAHLTVTLNKTTGAITVTGMFNGLSSPVTGAHVHGPATVQSSGPVLFPLTAPADVSGAVSGGAAMNAGQMADMLNRMTYVDIHTSYFADGEIRAQVSDASDGR